MKPSDDGLKQRLIGAVVLLAIAVIFLPVLFDRKRLEPIDTTTQIPPEPHINPIIITPPVAPPNLDPAPAPDEMFVPDETAEAKPTIAPIRLSDDGQVQPWVLQVASFRDSAHAKDLTVKLISAGYTAFSRQSQHKNGPLVRVYIGPKLDKEALVKIQEEVNKKYQVESLLLEFRAD